MPAYFKPSQYEAKLSLEFERLWINKTSVMILSLGKDKFSITDGNRSVSAKGHILLRVLKRLPDKAGYGKLWGAFDKVEGVIHSSTKKLVLSSN
jgi:hypothetical protein